MPSISPTKILGILKTSPALLLKALELLAAHPGLPSDLASAQQSGDWQTFDQKYSAPLVTFLEEFVAAAEAHPELVSAVFSAFGE